MRSTKSGTPASVVPISFSSSYAGTTTATLLPSSTLRVQGSAARHRLPEQRCEEPQQEPQEAGNRNGVSRRARGCLDGDRAIERPRQLDLLGQREQLQRLGAVLLDRPASLLCELKRVHRHGSRDPREAGASEL